jgi:hypothetical protein
MNKTTRKPGSRPSRGAGSQNRGGVRRGKAIGRSSAAATSTAGRTSKAGSRRCEAPNCGNTFQPRSDRQMYCSPACKVRAFYWKFKEQSGERYAARYERDRRTASTTARGRRKPARSAGSRRTRGSAAR